MKKLLALLLVAATACTGIDYSSTQSAVGSGSASPPPPDASPPPGDGSGAPLPGDGSTPPPGDGSGAPLPGDGSTPPPGDGSGAPPPGDGSGAPPGDGSGAPPDGTCSSDESCDGDETCNSGGTCEECTSITVPGLIDGEAPPPPATPLDVGGQLAAKGEVGILQAERLYAEVLRDGTIIIRNAAGQTVQTLTGVLVRSGTGWIIPQAFRNPVPEILTRITGWTFRCASGIGLMLLGAEMANAGMNLALGPLAGQIGVRQKDCQDRFAAAAGGIQCLLRQPGTKSCSDTVSACPDAFFGANLVQSCGTEPGMADLVAALAAAIGATSTRAGGRGWISPDLGNLIGAAIQSGQFATNPQMTCTMRPSTQGCTFSDGSVFTVPGFAAAKACWEGARRGLLETKYEQAQKCCAGNAACLAELRPMQDC